MRTNLIYKTNFTGIKDSEVERATPHIYGNLLMVHTVRHHLFLLSIMFRCIGSVYETQTCMQHITTPPPQTTQTTLSVVILFYDQKYICMFTVTRPTLNLDPYPWASIKCETKQKRNKTKRNQRKQNEVNENKTKSTKTKRNRLI